MLPPVFVTMLIAPDFILMSQVSGESHAGELGLNKRLFLGQASTIPPLQGVNPYSTPRFADRGRPHRLSTKTPRLGVLQSGTGGLQSQETGARSPGAQYPFLQSHYLDDKN